jgi:ABC-type ATPase involved in cell division
MDIRKISIGADYKSGAMHYIVGQSVLGGSYVIHLIQHDESSSSFKIWIEKNQELIMWKEFKNTMPISVEYNLNF